MFLAATARCGISRGGRIRDGGRRRNIDGLGGCGWWGRGHGYGGSDKGMVKKGFEIDPFSGVPFQQTEEKVSQLRRGAVWNPEKKEK